MKRTTRKMMVLFLIALLGTSGEITKMQSSVMAATKTVIKPDHLINFTANVKIGKNVRLSTIVSKEILAKCNLKPMYVTKKERLHYILQKR
ncbi:MAG: hypothetical protein HDT30_11695 [Clostridiales bacterium]|nr:hypothetical protein [Clostridiales bacterium]